MNKEYIVEFSVDGNFSYAAVSILADNNELALNQANN